MQCNHPNEWTVIKLRFCGSLAVSTMYCELCGATSEFQPKWDDRFELVPIRKRSIWSRVVLPILKLFHRA